MNLLCAKCGEPWDGYGVNSHYDMSAAEARRFKLGRGCPCCAFGTICPPCGGTGTEAVPNGCKTCFGSGHVLVYRLANAPAGHKFFGWHYNYQPNTRVYVGEGPYKMLKQRQSADGPVAEGWAYCPVCHNSGPTCQTCDGTGKFTPLSDADKANQEALAAILENDEGDPLGYITAWDWGDNG